MAFNLKNRNCLTLLDFSAQEIEYLLDLAEKLKENRRAGITGNNLQGKNIALIFEKTSTRTRAAFTVGARDEGGYPEFLGKNDIQLGKKESVADTARVLGRMFDGIQYRGFEHSIVEELGEYAGVPVWNGLTDKFHPTQILADLLTIKENFGTLSGLKVAYCGDGRNNVARSLLVGTAIMGLDFSLVAPESLQLETKFVKRCHKIAEKSGSHLTVTEDPVSGVEGANVLYTDVWVSMGEEDQFAQRIELLQDYQVNMEMIENTGQKDLIFLHCLPAYHNRETDNGEQIYQQYGLQEMEVTDEVFESKYSRVFEQAENRMHTAKAVMVATL